jgi:hypothetical protein
LKGGDGKMTIAEFLVTKDYGKNVHEVKKKLYKTNEVRKIGFVFMVNGEKVTDINYLLNTGDELFVLYNGRHKYTI